MTRSAACFSGVFAATVLIGCGAPPRTPGPPGETLVLLENKVDGPCEITWADAQVDRRNVNRVIITPPGARPAVLDRAILPTGQHAVTISALVACPGKADDPPPAVLRMTQPVYMQGGGSGQITITLSKDASSESGLTATFQIEGGHVLSPRADGGDVDCRGRVPVDRAICRTEGALAEARKRRDVVLAQCISEKLREMRLVTETASPPMISGASAPELEPALRDAEMEAARRVLTLAREADQCLGEMSFAGDSMRVDPGPNPAVSASR